MNEQISKENVQDILELTTVQKGMLFHYLDKVNENIYNVQLSLLFEGPLHPVLLEEAFGIVQEKNEALRSVFRWEEVSRPVQIILKQYPFKIPVYDISADDVAPYLHSDQQERFDLTKLPVRLSILKISSASFIIVLSHHHILYDGWSTSILLEELLSVYNHLAAAHPVNLPDKPTYKTIRQAIEQHTPSAGTDLYWKQYLKNYKFSSFLNEKGVTTSNVSTVKKIHLKTSIEDLEIFTGIHKVTKAAVIYAAYGLLLQQYCDQSDVIFGAVVSDRQSMIQGHERIIGNFINTIPLRMAVAEHITLLEAVTGMHKDLLDHHEFTSTPYAAIKSLLGLKVAEDLFDTVIVIENYPLNDELLKSLSTFNIRLKSVYENTGIPLVLTVFFEKELLIELSYRNDRMSDAFAASVGEHLLKLLNEILTQPDKKANSLSLLSEGEEYIVTQVFNDTKSEYPEGETIVSLFNKQVDKTPENIALKIGKQTITYRELHETSARITSYLERVADVRKGDLVGIMLKREEWLIPSLFGILGAGAAYIPIDIDYPPERINSIISLSSIKALITRGHFTNEITTVLDLDKCSGDIMREPLKLSGGKAAGNDLAYVIYTSGSTGKPKGVMIEHHSVINRLLWMQRAYPLKEEDVLLQKTPVVFDVSVWELFWWSFTGASLCLLAPGAEKDPLQLKKAIRENKVTNIHFVPSMLDSFLSFMRDNGGTDELRSLRRVFTSGEALTTGQAGLFGRLIHQHNTRLINLYGPTEATVDVSFYECTFDKAESTIPIGKPIDNTRLYILDRNLRPTPIGMTGELYISGAGLARAYLGNSQLTNEQFIEIPSLGELRAYRTGDLARWLPDGNIEFLGRKDEQVKIRGFRIEPAEIENQLETYEQIKQARVIARQKDGNKYLVAYYLSDEELKPADLKAYLSKKLPVYMIPAWFVRIEKIPVNSNGKLDKNQLPEPSLLSGKDYVATSGEIEERIGQIWSEVLGNEKISTNLNFFDAGGDSIKVITLFSKLKRAFNIEIQLTDLFDHPTILTQGHFVAQRTIADTATNSNTIKGPKQQKENMDQRIAIIGMAGKFPGATNINEFWQNLANGKESIKREKMMNDHPGLVRAKGMLDGYDLFDPAFFNYIPSEAAMMDPQLRIFHECVWEAFEDAGYSAGRYPGRIGLYGGASPNPFYNVNVADNASEDWMEQWEAITYADKDFMCPRISYKLDLKGPSINVATACSTSLVAITMACDELLAGKCEMAAAGGVSVTLHDNDGYVYQKNMILSPDGKCKAFDESAAGTVGGNGAGVVILKRYEDAVRDGDNIHAVILGTAVNNDGARKVGFSAPASEGQARVITEAISRADIPAESISYIEAHGTATSLGDPVEIAGLIRAFNTDKQQFCAIGSVKTNIGHLDAAAGVAGLIKVILSLKNKLIPPSLHFVKANPHIDFASSPFYVNNSPAYWKNGVYPRRAGISSFGIGGTNAHIIVEETPVQETSVDTRDLQLMVLSAKTPAALARNREKLIKYLEIPTDTMLADIAYTLQTGREPFSFRQMIVCRTKEEAILLLKGKTATPVVAQPAPVVFLFSGQGSQYVNMYAGIYRQEAFFKHIADECFDIYQRETGQDLKKILFDVEDEHILNDTVYAQPALFIMEYAMAKLLINWGIKPQTMIGHSIGEYVAACISGVFSLEDALKLVIKRGELMQRTTRGSMIGISIREDELTPLLGMHKGVSLAAVNSSGHCVVSGSSEAVTLFADTLQKNGYMYKALHTSHAFHSSLMDEILAAFQEIVSQINFQPQQIPFISNYTGTTALDSVISSPVYWINHLRNEVKFAAGVTSILQQGRNIFIETGPGNTLATFVRSNEAWSNEHAVINVVRHPKQHTDDLEWLLNGIGEMWLNGVEIDWKTFYKHEKRRRVSLPTYSFEKISFPFIPREEKKAVSKNAAIGEWFYVPGWKSAQPLSRNLPTSGRSVLIFTDDHPISTRLIEKFGRTITNLVVVRSGKTYIEQPGHRYIVNADEYDDYKRLFESLSGNGLLYDSILYARIIPDNPVAACDHLRLIAKAAYENGCLPGKGISLLTGDLMNVRGDELLSINLSPATALLRVISQEYPDIDTSHIDISLSDVINEAFIDKLYDEITHPEQGKVVAIRNLRRWTPVFEKIVRDVTATSLPMNGVYLITGGLGDLGYTLSKYLIKKYKASLILLGRSLSDEKTVRLKELEELGGAVYYSSCDISDESAVYEIVKKGEAKLGEITGIIHAAGIAGEACRKTLHQLTRQDFEQQFSAKIAGLNVLKNIFEYRKLDFCLLTSSLSAILGGLRLGAYAAANAYMDYFVGSFRGRSGLNNWVSVNLDGLNLDNNGREGITSEELYKVFELILSLKEFPQLVVSVGDLDKRILQWVKVQRKEASKLVANDPEASAGLIATSYSSVLATEDRILNVWKEFFGIADISSADNFFRIGGDSLKAMILIARINKELNVDLSLTDLFNYPTVRELTSLLNKDAVIITEQETDDVNIAEAIKIPDAIPKEYYPLSSAQKRLYFLNQLDKDALSYNMPLILSFTGSPDMVKLQSVFNKLIERQESLRTSFGLVNEEPVQWISDSVDFEIEQYEADENEVEAYIQSFIRPFDLSQPPLMRVGFIKMPGDKGILMVDIHHIINDGVSEAVFINNFSALYNNEELPPMPLQYKSYAQWQQSDEQQQIVALQKDFWLNEFSGEIPVLDLPFDFVRPPVKSYEGNKLVFELNITESRALKSLAEREGATLFMVLLSIYNVLLSKISGQEDIIIGTPVSGRNHEDLQHIIGIFLNTIPLRNYPKKEHAFRDFLNDIRLNTIRYFEHQAYPYEDLVQGLRLERDTSHNPLFDVFFSYENFSRLELSLPDLSLQRYEYEHTGSKFDLTLEVRDKQQHLHFTFEYSSKLFKRETITQFEQYFRKIIAAVTADPSILIRDIEILPEEEKHLLLYDFNDTRLDYKSDETIISLFEKQVQRTPGKVAVVYNNSALTYRELDEQSNKVARYLREYYKVGKDDLIGIMVSRSERMLIGLLGILKAGGAYVPVDPSYPLKRIEYVLRDSDAKVLLTERKGAKHLDYKGEVLDLDECLKSGTDGSALQCISTANSLCYLIYTSGSTGLPKGVMITHGAVVNFFHGMSQQLTTGEEDCLLAVTSISFDISVLELFWPLCNGVEVVIHPSDISLNGLDQYIDTEDQAMDFSLFFFSSYTNEGDDKYNLLLEAAQYADREGFKAIWTPERHFHEFGGLFPNPSVISSALAMITERIALRSGSVVLPLHDEIRIVEEWSVVDNLSNGRIGLSFASGWNPNDFVLSSGNFNDRQKIMYEKIGMVQRLWKGESISRENGFGNKLDLRVFPEPVQHALPVWITSGGTEETFIKAGAIGANLLTHLLGQDINDLEARIRLYRQSRAQHGYNPDEGIVTIMLHTYIGEEIEQVEEIVEQPFTAYLESSLGLNRIVFEEEGKNENELSAEARSRILKSAFQRYYKTGSLIGTKMSVESMVRKLKKIGVNEIACLVDFGIAKNMVMEGLKHLNDLKKTHSRSFKRNHRPITIMQSTPSLVNWLEKDPESGKFIGSLRLLLLGGEALPLSLIQSLQSFTKAAIFNMYGPTETTIWSCVHKFADNADKVSIGKPIANTQVYILNEDLDLLPTGVYGDLYIGGKGLSIGYLNKPELSRQRFIDNPFRRNEKIYKTGDVARWLRDGTIEFIGRTDQQVKIRGYRIEPGEIESILLQHAKVREAVVVARTDNNIKSLVAYVASDTGINPVALREHLADHLPPYMIPAYFVVLDKLPLTHNGKIDRKALPDPEHVQLQDDYEVPKTNNEKLLAEIWSKVLGKSNISITDNFFAVGGDSIKSIQIISRLRNAGYEISAKDIFINQTIQLLAPGLKKISVISDQSAVTGKAPLTPIQQWYFAGATTDRHHYNQAVLLKYPQGISKKTVQQIFEKIQEHHDALRMVFKEENGTIISETMAPESISVVIEEFDLRNEEDQESALLYNNNKIQAGIDLTAGPLMRLGLSHMHDGSRLLIVIHHLVVDGISWRILFEDIERLYQQILQKKPLSLPLKTDSFQSWGKHLSEYKKTTSFRQAAAYWHSFPSANTHLIPRDHPSGLNTGANSRMDIFTLSSRDTTRLLTEANISFGTQVNDIMLTALVLSVKRLYGYESLVVDIEGHGREDINQRVNISRTVGWFTSIYKVLIKAEGASLSDYIKHIKENLRKIPNHGIDYLLTEEADMLSSAQLSFNYLGQFDADTSGGSFSIATESEGDMTSPAANMVYDWDLVGLVNEGELKVRIRYSTDQYNKETIDTFMKFYQESLLEVIEYCCSYGRTTLTPSDLTYKGLSMSMLDQLQQEYAVKDIYRLSSTQEGILYHSLMNKDTARFFIQTTCQLTGDLDITAIEKSMNYLMARYDVLRTNFLHDGFDPHLQLVLKEREIDFTFLKTSDKTQVQEQRLQARERPFNLSKDVLIRLVIMQTAEREYEFIWNYHHMLMDGWCMGILVNEFTNIYSMLIGGKEVILPPVKPYSQYIQWLETIDKEASAAFWQQYLSSYDRLATLPQKKEISAVYVQKVSHVTIEEKTVSGLHLLSRQYGVTINTIIQAAWGLLLCRYNNTEDVVFGSVVSGRPADIEGVETMVGLFINTIPVRIRCKADDTVKDFLQGLQTAALESDPHHYHPLSEIQSLSELGSGLLDHIMAFENFPLAKQVETQGSGKPFEIRNADFYVQTNYEFEITVSPMDEFVIRFDFNINKYDEEMIDRLGLHLKNIIASLVGNADGLLRDLSLYNKQETVALQHWLTTDLEQGILTTPIQKKLASSFHVNKDHIAIEYHGQSISYEELGLRSAQAASALNGIAAGSYIGVLFEDKSMLISSILGILQSRMAFVPLETTLPAARISSMIEQVKMRYILTDQGAEMREKIDPSGNIIWLTANEATGEIQQVPEYHPDDHVYVYFTSGSTGTPKGVIGRNKGLSHFIEWEISTFHIDGSFRFSQFTNPGFDAFTRDIFVPLCAGGTICIPDENSLTTSSRISRWIDSQQINMIHCVPSFFKLFGRNGLQKELFGSLKYILMAGEKILPYELKTWHLTFGNRIPLVNLYGPTETTMVKGYHIIDSEHKKKYIPIRAMSGAQFLILDWHMQVCPVGVTGEIYVRTPYRSAGYLDAAVTEKSFIINPYNNDKEDLLYRTGDWGREWEQGEIEIIGRSDHQVKIRGIRIEPDDIRQNILRYPGITEALVMTREDPEGEPALCAYLVSEKPIEVAALRGFLENHLPQYMVPAYLVLLPKLPLLANGKVDRKALPDPHANLEDDYVAPANATEDKLVDIWSEVLKLDKKKISTTKSFIELGGHSLKLLSLINKINQHYGISVSLKVIFDKKNIRNLADYLITVKQTGTEMINSAETKTISI